MRGTKTSVLLFAMATVIFSGAGMISGFQEGGIGEYVNVAPLKHGDWNTPPGHYGLMANYANSYSSKAPLNGNYLVTWGFVQPNLTDYFIVDVRAASAYCSGHIIDAVNIPFATVAEPYNLEKLPTDRPILVVCGSGILASQAGAILGMMGYQVRILNARMTDVPSAYKETCQ